MGNKLALKSPCFSSGHKIASLEVGKPIIDPHSKVAFYEKKLICACCGSTLEEIRDEPRQELLKKIRKENSHAPGASAVAVPHPADDLSELQQKL